MINTYILSDLTPEELNRIKKRSETDIQGALALAAEVIGEIKTQGDAAVVKYARKFDYAGATAGTLKVTPEEFDTGRATLDPKLKLAVETAHANILRFHERQMPEEMWMTELGPGILAGEKITPIVSAGLYVPRGKGSFPSVMLMLSIPAMVAKVEKVIVCTPPGDDGTIDAASLYAAELCGVRDVFKLGGIQAIAAMAIGTDTVPKITKILGPGNTYVTAAKRLLFGTVDVGLPAGPSEAIILADEHTDPGLAALDLLIEAEHGPDSAALLVTHSARVAEGAKAAIAGYLEELPEQRRKFCETVLSGYGGIMLTSSLEESFAFINDYAPEHLEILVEDPLGALGKIKNAGEILLGKHTPISIANYCLGLNAILPTGAFAKSYSSVSVFDFLKRAGVGYLTREGFDSLKETTVVLAEYEGFATHAMAVQKREQFLNPKTDA